MEVTLAYDQRTTLITSLEEASLSLATNVVRPLVSFQGRVNEPVLLRQLMIALHRVIIDDARMGRRFWTMDPVITVHPDRLFLEAFSTDESSYARLDAPLAAFEPEGETRFGTTNIDFTWGLRETLQHLRSSRRTMFAVGAGGFTVETQVGTRTTGRFEHKVDLPDTWLKGFLQVQGALAMRWYTFDVRPVDLLTVIHHFLDNKAKRPPHGMRVLLKPGQPVGIMLEPWDKVFTLKGTSYKGYERTIRLWGRKRLELLLGILPYAQKVTMGVLGRGLPHFYRCRCGPYTFTLVLSGWINNDWASGSAFDLLAPPAVPDQDLVGVVYDCMVRRLHAQKGDVVADTMLPPPDVESALFELCRAGRMIMDPASGTYRLRELFQDPLDTGALFSGSERMRRAHELFGARAVSLGGVILPENNVRPSEYRAEGQVRDEGVDLKTVAAVDTDGRLRFGQCACQFFQDHIMSRGPCEHILATRLALDSYLREQVGVQSASLIDSVSQG